MAGNNDVSQHLGTSMMVYQSPAEVALQQPLLGGRGVSLLCMLASVIAQRCLSSEKHDALLGMQFPIKRVPGAPVAVRCPGLY